MFSRVITATVAMCAALFMLAGCNYAAGDANVRALLVANCPAVEQNYAVFAAVASSGGISAGTVARVDLAKAQFDALCASPDNATVVGVITTASAAYLAIRNGLKEAEASGVEVGYPTQMRQLRSTVAKMKREIDRHGR